MLEMCIHSHALVFKALDGNGNGRLSRQVRKRDAFLCLYVLVTLERDLYGLCCAAQGAAFLCVLTCCEQEFEDYWVANMQVTALRR